MKSILLNENDIRNLINEIINEVYRKGWSVNPADANDMLEQFVQAYEAEGPEGQTTNQIYGDIWGFAMTALKNTVSKLLGGQFDSFYYPDAVDKQFVEKKEETMKIIYDGCKAGNDVLYDLARFIANKLKDINGKNATRSGHHLMAADTRDDQTERDVFDTLADTVQAEDETIDILEKMKMYLQSYNEEMPAVIRQILQDIIRGIESMKPEVKEEIMSMDLTDKAMQQMILMTALTSAANEEGVPYPELQMIVSKYRKIALYMMAQRTGSDPRQLQASPKDIKNAIVDKNPNGVLAITTDSGEEKEYHVSDVMVGIDSLFYTRAKLSRLKTWFNEHDLDFEKMAQNARVIAENKKRVITLTENDIKNLIRESVKRIIAGYLG